ncbi:class I SAM-dependent RNA methyltransferase [Sphingomicrobium astaxanthinifaciens]|uniref:class I SAM-dependent RNA methyltransferase n=1 Tax=Sphingomicrobium astaxanthinifaciens TaxID=1227949 RepID=UPI001FCB4458|nr:class I SAM-dependent RNA methyltransferase [Sphingomicrobium astaxanthinifaciens]MCJ7422355.1 class I SAM-dependent RNA methyltransferase [Sphingomicrobium astaxanthinifaciens]
MSETVVRIAGRGDGVTDAGSYVALAAPGDTVEQGEIIARGAGYQEPPCRHFPQCGGCQLQHLTDAAFADYCRDRIAGALAQKGIETELRAPHISPPRSRRRADLKALRLGKKRLLGFTREKSHQIVDMRECHVLAPELFALLAPLRDLLDDLLPQRRSGRVQMTLTNQGVDLLLGGIEAEGLEAAEALPAFAERQGLARLSVDEGYGAEARYEPQPVTVTLGGVPVPFPQGGFLQATLDGEAALVAGVKDAVADSQGPVLDLFAGLGTFALSLDRPVVAAEAGREAILSLMQAARRAGRSVEAVHRDLYRRPYDGSELEGIDAVVLDPPRSGAEAQCRQLAGAKVARIAYVSCNPGTFARDAAILLEGGYRLDWVRPVGQFRWSTHVELVAAFSR